MAAAFVGGAAINGIKAVVSAASDAQQSMGATETVFGKFSKTVIDNSNKAAKAVGLSANTYRENANLIGSLFANKGLKGNELAKQTDLVIKKGADLSATFGGSATEAVGALSSALKGEFDPLERYGISMKQSTINTAAAALAQQKYGKDLKSLSTEQTNAINRQATMNIINEQSKKSQGAFAKETNTLAHQQQVLGAQFDNLKAKLGSALLPVITTVLTVINTQFSPAIKAIGTFLSPVVEKVKEFFSGLGSGSGQMSTVAALFRTFGTTVTQTIIPAVTTVVTYLASKLMPVFTQVAGIIQTRVLPIFAAVGTFILTKLVPAIVAIYGKVANNLKPVFEQLVTTFQAKVLPAINKLLAKFQEYGPTMAKVVTAVVKVVGAVADFASTILGKVLPVAIRFAGFLAGTLFAAIGTAIGVVVKIAGAVVDFGAKLVSGGQKVADFAQKVGNKVGDVLGFFRELPGKVISAVGNVGKTLYSAGSSLIQGLLDGITSKFNAVKDKLGELTGKLTDWKGPPEKDAVLLKPAGKSIIDGLIAGFESAEDGVKSYLEGLTKKIATATEKTFKNDKVAAAQTKSRVKSIMDEAKALNAKAREYDKFTENLANQKQILADLIQASAEYAKGIADNIKAYGNLTALGSRSDSEGNVLPVTAQNIINDLSTKVQEANEFAALIQSLTQQGLDKTSIQQLIDAGVDGGLATARALAAGGPAAIAQVVALQGALQATGTALGTNVATTMQGAGIAIQQGIVSGLEDDKPGLEKAMERLAKKLAKAFKKAMQINSPSRVFEGLAGYINAGIEKGLKDTRGIEREMRNVSGVVQNGFDPRLGDFASTSVAAGGNVVYVTYEIKTDMTTDYDALGKKILNITDNARRNGARQLAIG